MCNRVRVCYAPSFFELDKDLSGYISVDEVTAVPGLAEQITEVDAIADGKINPEEYPSMTQNAPPPFLPTLTRTRTDLSLRLNRRQYPVYRSR